MARKAHFHHSVPAFLEEYTFHNDAPRALLLICSTRDQFLKRLLVALQTATTTTQPDDEHSQNPKLLSKSIGLLSKSNKTKLVFCPTLESLRAYLSSVHITADDGPGEATVPGAFERKHGRRPVLAVLDLLGLHCLTAEYSAQGLSRTLASVVEAAAREGADVELCECLDAVHPAGVERGEDLWRAKLPLLSDSVRAVNHDAQRGHCVPLGRVVRRWFELGR